MKLEFKFRHIERSAELTGLAEARLSRLDKFEWQPLKAHVGFSAERHQCCVEVRLIGRGFTFKAVAKADSYPEAMDAVAGKLQRQLARKKARVQDHLVYENTHFGKIDRAQAEREAEFADELSGPRKAG